MALEIRPSASLRSLQGRKRKKIGLEAAEAAEKNELYARRCQEREARATQEAEESKYEYQEEAGDKGWEVGEDAEVVKVGGGGRERVVVSSDTGTDLSSLPQPQDESGNEASRSEERSDRLLKRSKFLLEVKEGKGMEKKKPRTDRKGEG